MNQRKSKINFRPLLCFAVCLLLGIVFAREVTDLNIVFCIIFSVVVALCFIFFHRNKKWIYVLLFVFAFFFGTTLYLLKVESFNSVVEISDKQVFTATIEQKLKDGDDYVSFLADDLAIKDEEVLKGKLVIYISKQEDGSVPVKCGSTFIFNSKLEKIKIESFDGINTYYAKYNVAYICFANEVEEISFNPTLAQKIQSRTYETISSAMGEQEGSVAYACLFGDKSVLPETTKATFNAQGIGHVLAVSGLHVGFISLILLALFTLLGIKILPSFFILLGVLGFYCYLCNFSCSVVRASIIVIALAISWLFKRQSDILSSLSFAMILLLLFNPLYALDGGFLMSFCCVFCLVTLSKTIKNLLLKIRLHEKISNALAPVLAIQLGMFPIFCTFFQSISVISLVANLLVLPLFELAFILLFISLPLAFISSGFASVLLFLPNRAFGLVLNATNLLLPFTFPVQASWNSKTALVSFYALVFTLSSYVRLGLFQKRKAVCAILVLIFCSSYFSYFFSYQKADSLTIISTANGFVYVSTNCNRESTIFVNTTSKSDIWLLEDYLNYSRISSAKNYIADEEFKSSIACENYNKIDAFEQNFDGVFASMQNYAIKITMCGKIILLSSQCKDKLMFSLLTDECKGKFDYFVYGSMVYDKNLKPLFDLKNKTTNLCVKNNALCIQKTFR